MGLVHDGFFLPQGDGRGRDPHPPCRPITGQNVGDGPFANRA